MKKWKNLEDVRILDMEMFYIIPKTHTYVGGLVDSMLIAQMIKHIIKIKIINKKLTAGLTSKKKKKSFTLQKTICTLLLRTWDKKKIIIACILKWQHTMQSPLNFCRWTEMNFFLNDNNKNNINHYI